MTLKMRVGVVFATLLAAVTGLVGMQSAMAAPSAPSRGCNIGWNCFYDGAGDPEPVDQYSPTAAIGYCLPVEPGVTSWVNNDTNYQWKVFLTGNCTGSSAILYAKHQGYVYPPWNNSIGSTYKTGVKLSATGTQPASANSAFQPARFCLKVRTLC